MPAVSYDGNVKEIFGKATNVYIHPESKRGLATITDIKGDEHSVSMGSTAAFNVFNASGVSVVNMRSFRAKTQSAQSEEMLAIQKRPLLFRVRSDGEVMGVVSTRWRKTDINELSALLKENFPDLEIEAHAKPNGEHGGVANIVVSRGALAKVVVRVDAGKKDGMHSISLYGGANILRCKNEMSTSLGREFLDKLDLPNVNLTARHVHVGDLYGARKTIEELSAQVAQLEKTIEETMAIELDNNTLDDLLDFHSLVTQRISTKTAEAVKKLISDPEIAQMPGTLYGFAMVASWLGTHGQDMRDGVMDQLQRVAGEAVVCSQAWPQYTTLVKEKAVAARKRLEEERKAREAVKKAKPVKT